MSGSKSTWPFYQKGHHAIPIDFLVGMSEKKDVISVSYYCVPALGLHVLVPLDAVSIPTPGSL